MSGPESAALITLLGVIGAALITLLGVLLRTGRTNGNAARAIQEAADALNHLHEEIKAGSREHEAMLAGLVRANEALARLLERGRR